MLFCALFCHSLEHALLLGLKIFCKGIGKHGDDLMFGQAFGKRGAVRACDVDVGVAFCKEGCEHLLEAYAFAGIVNEDVVHDPVLEFFYYIILQVFCIQELGKGTLVQMDKDHAVLWNSFLHKHFLELLQNY